MLQPLKLLMYIEKRFSSFNTVLGQKFQSCHPSNFANDLNAARADSNPGHTRVVRFRPDSRLFLRPQILTASNFAALYTTDPILKAWKDLNPPQNI